MTCTCMAGRAFQAVKDSCWLPLATPVQGEDHACPYPKLPGCSWGKSPVHLCSPGPYSSGAQVSTGRASIGGSLDAGDQYSPAGPDQGL